jgi:hypothetical protein
VSFVPVLMSLIEVYGKNDLFGMEICEPGVIVTTTPFLFKQGDPSMGLTHDQVEVMS